MPSSRDHLVDPPIVPNVKCTVPQEIYSATLGFLADELINHRQGTTPAVTAGFVRSDPATPDIGA